MNRYELKYSEQGWTMDVWLYIRPFIKSKHHAIVEDSRIVEIWTNLKRCELKIVNLDREIRTVNLEETSLVLKDSMLVKRGTLMGIQIKGQHQSPVVKLKLEYCGRSKMYVERKRIEPDNGIARNNGIGCC